jgi:predicted nucleic acid-binding protein
MTKILCDTDILSVFAKIDRLDLLEEAFPNADLQIVEEVYDELEHARENEYSFPEKIFQTTDTVTLKQEELEEYREKKDRAEFLPLSKADLKTFVAANEREILLLSNDSHLLEVSDQEQVLALDIYEILEILYQKNKIDREQIQKIGKQVKQKDNLDLPDLDKIGR